MLASSGLAGRPVFRSVWIAWLMTSLTASPLLVALMQTAGSLRVVLVGLPAGALADSVDRRKLLLTTQARIPLAAEQVTPAGRGRAPRPPTHIPSKTTEADQV